MTKRFFGQFLLARKVISEAHLVTALTLQARSSQNVGEICQSLGLLDQAAVARILEKQKRVNLRFGEIALHEGFLTPEQLEHVLGLQRASQLKLGEALLRIRALSPEVLEQELKDFNAQEAESAKLERDRADAMPHAEFVRCITQMTINELLRIGKMTAKTAALYPTPRLPKNKLCVEVLQCRGPATMTVVAACNEAFGVRLFEAFFGPKKGQQLNKLARVGVLEFFALVALHVCFEQNTAAEKWVAEPAKDPYHPEQREVKQWIALPLVTAEDELVLLFDVSA